MAKILVVDDEETTLLIIRRIFENAGHEVIATLDPGEAMELAESRLPDAVTIDAMMPVISGWDLLEMLRSSPTVRGVPVLMLTALGEVSDRVRGLRSGADDYLVKPFEHDELLARIEGLIARSKARLQSTAETSRSLEETLADLENRIREGRDFRSVRLGRYEIRALLGTGAMGRVLHGFDPKLQRAVALKTIRIDDSGPSDSRGRVKRLLNEAVAGARFNHPHIVTVYDVDDQGSAAYIAMELVDGVSLEMRLAREPRLSTRQVLPLAAAVARALATAHDHDLLHRDVKPGNVLLGRAGSIKVSDFGISEWISHHSSSGNVFGTAGYLAPECFLGGDVSVSTDLFSLGVVLYECLTGRHPFAGANWGETLRNTAEMTPTAPSVEAPDLPSEVSDMVLRLISKTPEQRPASAHEAAELFESLVAEEGLAWTYDMPGDEDSGPAVAIDLHSRWIPTDTG